MTRGDVCVLLSRRTCRGGAQVDVGNLLLGDAVGSVRVISSRTHTLLHFLGTFHTDSHSLDVGVEADAIIVLTRGDVRVLLSRRTRRGGTKVDVGNLLLGDTVGSFMVIGSRTHALSYFLRTFNSDSHRFDIRVEADAVIILARSDICVVFTACTGWR